MGMQNVQRMPLDITLVFVQGDGLERIVALTLMSVLAMLIHLVIMVAHV